MPVLAPTRPIPSTKISVETMAVGLRAFFRIIETWNLKSEHALVLLGQPPRSTFFDWKRGRYGRAVESLDLATRLSLVLGIFKSLEIIYQQPEFAGRWISEPNQAFGGQSALQRMLAGQITDIAAVRDYLDSVRGGK